MVYIDRVGAEGSTTSPKVQGIQCEFRGGVASRGNLKSNGRYTSRLVGSSSEIRGGCREAQAAKTERRREGAEEARGKEETAEAMITWRRSSSGRVLVQRWF